MTRLQAGAAEVGRYLYLLAIAVFLFAPIVVIVLVSFSPTPVFKLNISGSSLRWYRQVWDMHEFWQAAYLSITIGAIAAIISLALGLLCAIGLIRGRFPGRDGALLFVLSPIILPGVVLGISMLFAFRSAGLRDGFASLLLAHIVITLPYVVRILHSGLSLFDFALIDAAKTLGCSPSQALYRVLLPNIYPSVLTAGLFAFLASLDNYALALFLGDFRTVTLPIQILTYLERAADPGIAAISTIMIVVTALIVLVAERMVGMRRLMGG